VVYFPIAIYLKSSYVPRELDRFRRLTGYSFLMSQPDLDTLADSSDNLMRSPLELYEDGKLIGPAHSAHVDIRDIGLGRFSHWQGIGLIFSTSDNSDPNTNGRRYSMERREPDRFRGLTGYSFLMSQPDLDTLADSSDNLARSPLELYEDGKPLGPAHSAHVDIRDIGLGRFSHWRGIGLIFSTSDNTDPNTNGRRYSIEQTGENKR
jgi:hypothetical protein